MKASNLSVKMALIQTVKSRQKGKSDRGILCIPLLQRMRKMTSLFDILSSRPPSYNVVQGMSSQSSDPIASGDHAVAGSTTIIQASAPPLPPTPPETAAAIHLQM